MNILIPMVGLGKRFSDAGFKEPKPLIKIKNKEIVRWSIESLALDGKYIFITRKYEKEEYNEQLNNVLKDIAPNSIIITVDKITEGATQSALYAKNYINNNDPLIITNCDQYLEWGGSKENFLNFISNKNIDGCVTTYDHVEPKSIILNSKTPYSFIKTNKNKIAIEFSEKIAISKKMLNGIHFWRNGKDFVSSGEKIIENNIRYNDEFYISLTYNEMINKKKKITYFQMPKNTFFSLGTPEDLEKFKEKKI